MIDVHMPIILLGQMTNQLGIRLHESADEKLVNFIEKIIEWNNRTHLISRKIGGYDEVLKQVLDSLSLLRLDLEHNINIMDVGSGIGLPGMALAIARPDFMVRMVDSGERICVLARRMAGLLGVQNVEIIHATFPENVVNLARDTNLFVSKAFLSPKKWIAAVNTIAMPNSRAVIMTSPGRLVIPGNMSLVKDDEFKLPDTDMLRRNILVEKID